MFGFKLKDMYKQVRILLKAERNNFYITHVL
jgi:hypothetical protein